MDILEQRNKNKDDNSICNSERGNLKRFNSKFKHFKNASHTEKRMIDILPQEQENNNNFSTNENSSIGGTSNQPSIKIKKITMNLNETFEKMKGVSNEEEESTISYERTHKTHHTFSKKSSKNYDECTIEEIEKEEMDTINDLDDDDKYLNISISRKPSNNFKYIRKSNDRLDILINNNHDKGRRKSDSSLGNIKVILILFGLILNLNILNDLREIISMKVVNNMISRALKKNYSRKIIELISKMLELDERIRYSFEDIDKYLSENYNNI